MIVHAIEDIIGHTPLLKLDATHYGINHIDIYVKLEYLNPFGSIKDRTVRGLLPPQKIAELGAKGSGIIESSSGNSAKALQMMANKHGLKFTSVTNRIKIPEVEQLLRYLGTEIVALPGRSECSDPNDPDDAVGVIQRMVDEHPRQYHHTSQYTNPDNTLAHECTTAAELYQDLDSIDFVVMGVGTGGSSGGIINYATHHHWPTRHIGVVSDPNDFLPGIRTRSELFETELFHPEDYDEIREVTSLAAVTALRSLVIHDGVLAGPTTGASFAALLDYARDHDATKPDGTNHTAVFVACDRLESYLSYLMKRQPELFALTSQTDIYTLRPTPEEVATHQKRADLATSAWIKAHNVLVVDTRGVKPYAQFHIEGSVNYPEDYLREILADGAPFADRPLLFVCPHGDRSQLLASVLNRRGLESYSLQGGLLAWRTAGLPFIKKTAP